MRVLRIRWYRVSGLKRFAVAWGYTWRAAWVVRVETPWGWVGVSWVMPRQVRRGGRWVSNPAFEEACK